MNLVTSDFLYLAPMFIIAIAGCILVLAEAFFAGRDRATLAGMTVVGALAGMVASIILYMELEPGERRLLMSEMLVADRMGYALSALFCAITALTALATPAHQRAHGWVIGELYGVLLLTTVGTVMLAHAANLATIFLGVEIMSIGVYVMTAFRRRSRRGNEAAMKYFLMGAFATGFLLYGMALVYGAVGSTSLAVIQQRLASGNVGLLTVGTFMLVAAFSFKVAAVPFHMWAPDAYEGAPTPVTAFMAAGVKAAATRCRTAWSAGRRRSWSSRP